MPKLRIALALLLGCFASLGADRVVLLIETQFRGHPLGIQVTEDVIAKTPTWKFTVENPPLSARKAEAAARAFAIKKWPPSYETYALGQPYEFFLVDKEWWQTDSITLKPLGSGKWVYVVKMTLFPSSAPTGFYLPTEFIVLMDGSVVSPAPRKPRVPFSPLD